MKDNTNFFFYRQSPHTISARTSQDRVLMKLSLEKNERRELRLLDSEILIDRNKSEL